MNLFKVFASAKKGFQEEYASSIFAWLCHPNMEHGLGYTFLVELLRGLAHSNSFSQTGQHHLQTLAEKIKTKLRSDDINLTDFKCYLESLLSQR